MTTTSERSLARHRRIHRTLLLVYPRPFRQVIRSAPVQRMETEMTREAAFIILFVVSLAAGVVTPRPG